MHLELYALLGFDDNKPTSAEIKKAYRSLSKDCHPDLHPNDEDKRLLFLAITEAYEVLMDDSKRAEYDKSGFVLSSNDEVNIRNAAINQIMQTITLIINQVAIDAQLDQIDVKATIIQNIIGNKDNLREEINNREAFIKKMNRIVKNFKLKGEDNIIGKAAEIGINAKKEEIKEINKAFRTLEVMEDILQKYDYETIQEMQVYSSASNNTTSTFGCITIRV